jgi:hypothetical protein
VPERVERDICSRMCRSVCPGIPPLAGWAEHPLRTGGSEIKLNGEKRNKWGRNSPGARSGAFGANSTSDPYVVLSSSRARAARSSSLHITAPPRRLRRPPLGTPLFSACDSRVMRVCRRSAVSHARLLAPSGAAAFGRTGASGAPQPEGRPRCRRRRRRCDRCSRRGRIWLHWPATTRTTLRPCDITPNGRVGFTLCSKTGTRKWRT